MSISLVVLRFEVADDSVVPSNLDYCAPEFNVMAAASGKDEETITSVSDKGQGDTDDTESSTVSEQDIKLHRGDRLLHDVQIETLTNAVDQAMSEVETPLDQDEKGKEETRKSSKTSPRTEAIEKRGKIAFFSGNPSVESVKGLLHIYKDKGMTSLKEGVARSEMICLLAVPAKMTCVDLLQFLAPSEEFIQRIKIIRDSTPNQYMVLLKFRMQMRLKQKTFCSNVTEEHADSFYNTFNGQTFNSLEEEVCHLVYVAKLETMKSSQGASLPCPGLTELPKCPVCLERMDESVEGVLTILCNHSFHGSCLSQWSDTSCPVCRYTQTPEHVDENKCSECDSRESLWICLICGYVGCGRYLRMHAYRHYQETQHTFSLELGTQRVWDYTGDNFVHRLIQNKTDGKLVEFNTASQFGDEDEKLDSLTLEYTYLLTNQLENQRLYFHGKIRQIEEEAAEQVAVIEERSKKNSEECKKLEHQLADGEKEKRNIEKKYAQVVGKVGKLISELKDEKEMNKCLRENQKLWQDQLQKMEEKFVERETERRKEITELQEQIGDLMRHLETREAISAAPDETQQELQEGQLCVGGSPSPAPQTTKKGRRKNK